MNGRDAEEEKTMKEKYIAKPWLWPDRTIGKRESRVLREEHNALFNSHAELLAALEGLFRECVMIHKHWGDNCNQPQADAAKAAAHAAIAKSKGEA